MNRFLKHYSWWFCRYHSKEGKFILYFDKKNLIFDCSFFLKQNKFIVCVLLTIYKHYTLLPFSNIWFKNNYFCCHCILSVTAYSCYYSHKWQRQSLFVLFVVLLQSYDYGVTWFWLTTLILSTVLEHNIYRLVFVTEKKIILSFLEKTLFLRFDWF